VRVGTAFGAISSDADDETILPDFLGSDSASLSLLIGGYIWAKFRRVGWQWLDQVQMSDWKPSQIAEVLAYLPFTAETWKRAAELLSENESLYWSSARVNPFEAGDDIDTAIEHLIVAGRVPAAIDCIARRIFQKHPINPEHALRALHLAAQSDEAVRQIDAFESFKSIKLCRKILTLTRLG
jgi:hypothetical protein